MPAARDPSRGSALLLLPAAVVVLCCLAAMAVDLSAAYLGRRQASSLADAAASSAAAVLDDDRWRARGEVSVDCGRAADVVRALAGRAPSTLRALDVVVARCDTTAVTVEVRADVAFVFAKALPGAPRSTAVAATATAEARVR